jgi:hypothetical protein
MSTSFLWSYMPITLLEYSSPSHPDLCCKTLLAHVLGSYWILLLYHFLEDGMVYSFDDGF